MKHPSKRIVAAVLILCLALALIAIGACTSSVGPTPDKTDSVIPMPDVPTPDRPDRPDKPDQGDSDCDMKDFDVSVTMDVKATRVGNKTLSSTTYYYDKTMQLDDLSFDVAFNVSVKKENKAVFEKKYDATIANDVFSSNEESSVNVKVIDNALVATLYYGSTAINTEICNAVIDAGCSAASARQYWGLDFSPRRLTSFLPNSQSGAYELRVEKVQVITEPIESNKEIKIIPDFGTIGVDPYQELTFDRFSSLTTSDRGLPNELQKEITDMVATSFLDAQRFEKLQLNLTKDDFAAENTVTDTGVVLNQNQVKAKATIGYKKYTLVYEIGECFANQYNQSPIFVTASKIEMPYGLDKNKPTPGKMQVTLLGQTGEAPVTSRDGESYEVSATQLPVFFASKLSANASVSVTNRPTVEYVLPDKVTLSLDETTTQALFYGGISDMIVTLSYNDGFSSSATFSTIDNNKSEKAFKDVYDAVLSAKTPTIAKLFANNAKGYPSLDVYNLTRYSTTPYKYDVTLTWGSKNYTCNMSVLVKRVLVETQFLSYSNLQSDFYEGDSLSFLGAVQVKLKWHEEIGDKLREETVTLTAENFPTFSTEQAGTYLYELQYEGTKILCQSYYQVNRDPVTKITVNKGSFEDLYVKGEPFEFTNSSIQAYFESGKERKVDVTADMISGYDVNKVGNQTITIAYKDATTTHTILVKEVSKLEAYTAPADKYCLGQKPTEMEIKVTFTDGDYDVLILTAEQIAERFDSSTIGNHTFSYTYGSKDFNFDFEIVESVFLYYSIDEENKTAQIYKMSFERPSNSQAIALQDCLNVAIPSTVGEYTVTMIRAETFKGQNGIRSITVPATVTSIGDRAFQDCISLATITIEGTPSIGSAILNNCTSLKNLNVSATALDKLYLFFNAKVADGKTSQLPALQLSVNFLSGSTALPNDYFSNIAQETKIAKVVFPASMSNLGSQTTGLELVNKFEVDEQNTEIKVINDTLYTQQGKHLYFYSQANTQISLTIPDGVKTIGNIRNNTYLQKVTIPSSVDTLQQYAFANCSNLAEVKFIGSLNELPNYAFSSCPKLVTFNFPAGLKTIGTNVLTEVAINTVIIPDSVTSVGSSTLYNSTIKRLYIPSHLTDYFNKDKGNGDLLIRTLEELVYSGSIPLEKVSAYNGDGFSRNTVLKKVYVTKIVCNNFIYNANCRDDIIVYATKDVTKVGSRANVAFGSLNLYSENEQSAVSVDSTTTLSKNTKWGTTFIKWWL